MRRYSYPAACDSLSRTRLAATVCLLVGCYSPEPTTCVIAHYIAATITVRHGHGGREPSPYNIDVGRLVEQLQAYGAKRRPTPLLLYRETPPQHFPGKEGGGSYDTRTVHGANSRVYSPLGSDVLSQDVGPQGLNRIACEVVGASRAKGVHWLPAWDMLAARADAHGWSASRPVRTPGTVTTWDCTHWCYSPLLFDATLFPLWGHVVRHFRERT